MKNIFENDHAYLYIREGMLYLKFKYNSIIGLKEAITIVEHRLQLQSGESFPVLCDIRKVQEINREARHYFATEGTMLIKAVAFISDNPLSAGLVALLTGAYHLPMPTATFKHHDEAVTFLTPLINY